MHTAKDVADSSVHGGIHAMGISDDIVVVRFYIALFPALGQTHCALALDPTFGIHSHKTQGIKKDTAQPCHLLKPN